MKSDFQPLLFNEAFWRRLIAKMNRRKCKEALLPYMKQKMIVALVFCWTNLLEIQQTAPMAFLSRFHSQNPNGFDFMPV